VKALARQGVARVPGGRATPWDRRAVRALLLAGLAVFLSGAACGMALSLLLHFSG